jgi:hypothetical protein
VNIGGNGSDTINGEIERRNFETEQMRKRESRYIIRPRRIRRERRELPSILEERQEPATETSIDVHVDLVALSDRGQFRDRVHDTLGERRRRANDLIKKKKSGNTQKR